MVGLGKVNGLSRFKQFIDGCSTNFNKRDKLA